MSAYPPYPAYRPSGVAWLGEVPAHWEQRPFFALYHRRVERGYSEEQLLSVYREFGVVPREGREDNFNRPSEDLSLYQLVRPRDLVINKMKTWQGSVAISEHQGIVSPAYIICRPVHQEHDRYLHYLLRSPSYVVRYGQLSYGIRVGQWDMRFEDFRRVEVLLPPLPEQRAIAAFLDEKTAEIDTLIAAKSRLIELLREKRAALITQAVTHGLDPAVPMKESGVAWLGEVPEHWEVKMLKRLAWIRYGLGQPPKESGAGVPLIRATNINRGEITDLGMIYVNPDDVPSSRDAELRAGEIIVVRSGAYTGDSAIVPEKYAGAIAGYDLVATVNKENPRYIAWQLLSPEVYDLQFGFHKGRAAQPHLNAEELSTTIVLVPPYEEQQAIADYLDSKDVEIKELLRRIAWGIGRLKEYRVALISAAVTGKIDVRDD